MVSSLVVGVNSWVTLAEADAYLEDSLRAGATWSFVDTDDKKRALITAFRRLELLGYSGVVSDLQVLSSAAVASGGTGYAAGDVLTLAGGDFGDVAQVEVSVVSGGVVTAVTVLRTGFYGTAPDSPVSTTGGGGSGCTLTCTFVDQSTAMPRTGLTCDGVALESDEIPRLLEEAQIELAFELTQDEDLEGAASTGSNLRRAKAGSAEVEFFAQQEGTQVPPAVLRKIACLLGTGTLGYGAKAYGTDVESQFDDCDRYNSDEPIY